MQSAQLVRIDNTGNETPTSYQITAGDDVLPAGNDGATIPTSWGPNGGPQRPPNSTEATGTVPAGKTYAFYVTGGIVATEADGPATWIIDGEIYDPNAANGFTTSTISGEQPTRGLWHHIETGVQQPRVICAKPLSFNGSNPAHTRLRNVTEGSFEYTLEEWEYLDGRHGRETFHMLAVEPTEHEFQLSDGTQYRMKAGTVSVSTNLTTVSLADFFGTTLVVLAQTQTFNGNDPIVTRLTDVSRSSFRARVQEEEQNAMTSHNRETVGYIALQQGTGQLNGTPFEVARTGTTVTDQWSRITFQQQYDVPQFLANQQTFRGSDPANLRYRNLSGTGVEVNVEEEQSADTETGHAAEAIGYVVVEGSG